MEICSEMVFAGHDNAIAHENLQWLWLYVQIKKKNQPKS